MLALVCINGQPTNQSQLIANSGTGIWAIDMADQYPSAEVVGIDITYGFLLLTIESPTNRRLVPFNRNGQQFKFIQPACGTQRLC